MRKTVKTVNRNKRAEIGSSLYLAFDDIAYCDIREKFFFFSKLGGFFYFVLFL